MAIFQKFAKLFLGNTPPWLDNAYAINRHHH
jgi:hypothetical protein